MVATDGVSPSSSLDEAAPSHVQRRSRGHAVQKVSTARDQWIHGVRFPWQISGLAISRQVGLFWYNLGYPRTMKTAVSMPDDLFHLAEAAARRLRVSRSELYANAITEYLNRQ